MPDDLNIQNGELISVVIPSYNHGNFLSRAIESVLTQSYTNAEIIVVDDGSTDNTRQVSESFPGVRYVFQQNQGLSAARNTGIDNSNGKYLLFLDADDWLTVDMLRANYDIIRKRPDVAFVSAGHVKITDEGKVIEEVREDVRADHYIHLLQ